MKPQIEAASRFLKETAIKVTKTEAALTIFNKKVKQAELELEDLLDQLDVSLMQKNKEHAITSLMQSQIELQTQRTLAKQELEEIH